MIRAQEIGSYIHDGFLDCGITGYDWVYENGADLEDMAELRCALERHSSVFHRRASLQRVQLLSIGEIASLQRLQIFLIGEIAAKHYICPATMMIEPLAFALSAAAPSLRS